LPAVLQDIALGNAVDFDGWVAHRAEGVMAFR
jgi:hypothetical protein